MTEEGVHRDVYRDGEKVRTQVVSPPISATDAFDYAEDDLDEHVQLFVRRFERWHDINERTNQ